MDKLAHYRTIIKTILQEHAQYYRGEGMVQYIPSSIGSGDSYESAIPGSLTYS
jgi:hypothetical protein